MEILRLVHAHPLGRQRQHHRGLHLAGMHTKAVLMRAELRIHVLALRIAQRQVEPTHAVDQHA